MAFCNKCGQQLRAEALFCPGCGAAARQPAPAAGKYAPVSQQQRPGISPPVLVGVLFAILVLVIGGVAVWQFGLMRSHGAENPGAEPAESATLDEVAAWKAGYTDTFVSDPQTLFLTGLANIRDYPSSTGTRVLRSLPEGSEVTGRLVAGRDPEQRWFKLDDGGYIWDGNIGSWETIYPSGMTGLFVDRQWRDFVNHLSSEGVYGGGPEGCEIYNSFDQRFSVMFENNRATSFTTSSPLLTTQEGIRVGMELNDLREAYGDTLVAEPNPYDGADYFVWQSEERGLRFHVGNSGRVETIWSGTQSIRYVEGCL